MASPVDTSVKHLHSGMAGAPTLNGVAGSMIDVLDAVLVTGCDFKNATSLAVLNGVATLSFSGSHSATVESVVLVSGVTGALSALNGEQKVKAIGSGSVSFATASANGTATGTVSFKMAPAGWAKVFSATNIGVYRSQDPAGTQMYLRVDDTGTTSCRVIGYESMTDIDTGVGPFPLAAQQAGGGFWAKSYSANSNAVRWSVIADARTALVSVAVFTSQSTSAIGSNTRMFGDIVASKPGGDAFACVLGYSSGSNFNSREGCIGTANSAEQAMPRSFTGLGSCVLHSNFSYTGINNALSGQDPTLGSFPSPIDGGLRLSKRYVSELQQQPPRGDIPGLYTVPQTDAGRFFYDRVITTGTGILAGRKLFSLTPTVSNTSEWPSNVIGVMFVDITGPWR